MPPFRTVTHEKPKFNTYFSNTLHTNFLHLRAVGSTHFLQTDFNPLVNLLHLHPRSLTFRSCLAITAILNFGISKLVTKTQSEISIQFSLEKIDIHIIEINIRTSVLRIQNIIETKTQFSSFIPKCFRCSKI